MVPEIDNSNRWTIANIAVVGEECNKEPGIFSIGGKNSFTLPTLPDPSNESGKKDGGPSLYREMKTLIFGCIVCLASGTSLGFATPALTSLNHSSSLLKITESEGSWMASLVMLGGMVGGFLSGFCISFGRKNTLWFISYPLFVSWIITYCATSVWYLYASHLIMGICMGVISDASQIYVSEMASRKWRGALGCIPLLMFNVGILLSYIAGAYLTWYNLAAFGACVTAPALVIPYVLPESPIYLVVKGKMDQASGALLRVRGADYNIEEELKELEHCDRSSAQDEKISLKDTLKGIKSLKWCDIRGFMIPFLHTIFIRALSRFCGLRAILCYIQIIFNSTNSNIDSDVTTIATGTFQLIATLAACMMLDRLGRRFLLVMSQFVMGLALIGLGLYLYFQDDTIDSSMALDWIPLLTILIYIIANSVGLGPVSGIVIGEIVPQRYRGIVSSTTGAFSWLSAFVITKTFYDLRSCLYLHGAMWAYATVCIVGSGYAYFAVPETRGLSQIEIETLFDKNKDKTEEEKKKTGCT